MWFWRIFLHFLLKLNRGPSLAGSVGSRRRHWRRKQVVWVQFAAPPQPSPRTPDKLLVGSSKCCSFHLQSSSDGVCAIPSITTCSTPLPHAQPVSGLEEHPAPVGVMLLQGKQCEPQQAHILDISICCADQTRTYEPTLPTASALNFHLCQWDCVLAGLGLLMFHWLCSPTETQPQPW